MTSHSGVFLALIEILKTKQPIAAAALLDAMKRSGFNSVESRRAIQLAFERGRIKLDPNMQVIIVEPELAAA